MIHGRCNSTREAAEPELRAANGWLLVSLTPRGSNSVSSSVFLDIAPGKGATWQGSLEQRDICARNVVCKRILNAVTADLPSSKLVPSRLHDKTQLGLHRNPKR